MLIDHPCCFSVHRFRGMGIVAIIMMILDSTEFDSENITHLFHVPSAVPKFALLQTTVITARFYLGQDQEKDLVQNHCNLSELLFKKICFISGFKKILLQIPSPLFSNSIRK